MRGWYALGSGRQNTEMMRAQMHNDSMSIRVQRRFDYANSGEIAGIYGKLTAGMGEAFLEPTAEALALLSEEELYRFRSDTIGMRDYLADLFYQCRSGYLDDEFCDYWLRNQIAAMLKIWAAAEILIIGQRPSFLREIQRIGREEGLPIPNDEGRWD